MDGIFIHLTEYIKTKNHMHTQISFLSLDILLLSILILILEIKMDLPIWAVNVMRIRN